MKFRSKDINYLYKLRSDEHLGGPNKKDLTDKSIVEELEVFINLHSRTEI